MLDGSSLGCQEPRAPIFSSTGPHPLAKAETTPHYRGPAVLAQLVRAFGSHPKGRGFESLRRHKLVEKDAAYAVHFLKMLDEISRKAIENKRIADLLYGERLTNQ